MLNRQITITKEYTGGLKTILPIIYGVHEGITIELKDGSLVDFCDSWNGTYTEVTKYSGYQEYESTYNLSFEVLEEFEVAIDPRIKDAYPEIVKIYTID